MTSLLFGIIKNDSQWIDEWVRYHLALGFSHILIYDNNEGLIDYPMSEYIINKCNEGVVTVVSKRNLLLDKNFEFICLNSEYDYEIMLEVNEFLTIKNGENINDFLNDKKYSLYIDIIPYDVINETETINLPKYKTYLPKHFRKSNSGHTEKTNEIYVKKILSIQ